MVSFGAKLCEQTDNGPVCARLRRFVIAPQDHHLVDDRTAGLA